MRRNRHDRVLVAERAKIKIGQAIPRNRTNNGGDSFRKTCSTSSARQNHISPNFALKRNTLSPRQIRTSTRAKKSKNIYTQKKRKRPHPTQFFFRIFLLTPNNNNNKKTKPNRLPFRAICRSMRPLIFSFSIPKSITVQVPRGDFIKLTSSYFVIFPEHLQH